MYQDIVSYRDYTILRYRYSVSGVSHIIKHNHLFAVLLTSCLISLSFSCGSLISLLPESSSNPRNTVLDDKPSSFYKATEQEFYDMVQKFFQHFNEPAHFRPVSSPHTLDLVFS